MVLGGNRLGVEDRWILSFWNLLIGYPVLLTHTFLGYVVAARFWFNETFRVHSSSEPRVDMSDEEESVLGWKVFSLSKSEHHGALEVDAGIKIMSLESTAGSRVTHRDQRPCQWSRPCRAAPSLRRTFPTPHLPRAARSEPKKGGVRRVSRRRLRSADQIPSDLGFRRCSARSYSAASRTAQIAIWIAFRLPSSWGDLGPSMLFHRAAHALQQHSAVRRILAFGAAPCALQRRFTAAFSAALPTATPPCFGRAKGANRQILERPRQVLSMSKPEEHHNALEVDAGSNILSESFHAQSSSKEAWHEQYDKEPSLGASCTQLDSAKSDSDSHGKIGEDSIRKPAKPKRSVDTYAFSSMLSRNLSTFDLFDQSEKIKGNQGTRKLAAHDPQRSNESISLL
ncbi:hypothetical protein VNO78_00304 [Psophocarpus tetragonolobus]|uniref:Uncharacterized protein n=1 Tax=Psophocarpus tetragonolobus TaxID=3891 RepID=A0AAN9T948_PSOTE